MKLKALLIVGCLLGILPTANAADSAYPSRSVRLLVGFPPGGNIDLIARRVGAVMSRELGQQFVIDNRPGAASLIAADAVASAQPDGYTLMLATTSTLLAILVQQATRHGSSELDPISSFSPVAMIGSSPFVIAAHSSFPADDIPGFVHEVKENPGKHFYATSGVGSQLHLGMEVLIRELDLDMRHVPYKGAGQVLPNLLSGEQIKLAVMSSFAARNIADKEQGRIKIIGIMSGPRSTLMPELASFSEIVPNFEDAVSGSFLIAPPNTPADIVNRLSGAVSKALEDPQVVRAFGESDTEPNYQPPATLNNHIQQFVDRWQKIVANGDLQ